MNRYNKLLTRLTLMGIIVLLMQHATSQVNYVRTFDAKAPETNADNLITRPLRDMQQTTQYFDGLGRPLQTVVKQGSYATGSTSPVDMVSPVVYDAFGREAQKYLPYAATTSDGLLKPVANVLTDQAAFYNGAGSPIAGQGETYFYSQTNFEASPLNRAQEQFAPGNSWAGTAGQTAEADRRSVKIKYYANTAADAVRIWEVPYAAALGSWAAAPTSSIAYDAGQLYKTITIDEYNKQVIEFKDKQGKVVLKKVQADGTAADDGSGQGHAGWMCTYYLYDDFGNLRCVIQPEGVKALEANSWTFTTTILDHQCFRYEYDGRQRMIMKKVPGVLEADAVWMVYDTRDRLVMTQDGKQRAYSKKAWIVTHYDALNRPIQTGYYTNNHATISGKTFQQILEDAADQIDYPFAVTAAPGTSYYSMLTQTGYDNYDGMEAAGFYSVSTTLSKNFDNTFNNGTYIHTTYNTSPLYAQPLVQSFQTQGLVTWTKVKLSGANLFEYTVNIYDDKARPIQVMHRNHTGGTSVTTTQYSWAGQPLRNVHYHRKAGTPANNTVVITDMTYDDLGRLTLTQKKLSSNLYNNNTLPGEWTTIAENQYDALGQLKTKKLGKKRNSDGSYSSNALATLDYTYNIRGWLLAINKGYINNTDADRYFAMQLGYDKDPGMGNGGTKQYNGNVSSILWKSAGDQQRRKYNFTYDAANRLMGAAFGQYASGTGATAVFNTDAGVDFSEDGISYDLNGNLKTYNRMGLRLNASEYIDRLTYQYTENNGSNRLQKVTEASTGAFNGKLGDFKDGTNTDADYTYNPNGSIEKDQNKGISSISYHSAMELPKTITTANGTIEYMYNYLGEKNWKKTIDNSTTGKTITTTTQYIEGFVYESKSITPATTDKPDYSDKLQFAGHEEGRIRPLYNDATNTTKITGFVYDYFIKDHLGNVRTVITDERKEDLYPMATMETAKQATEEKYYSNINTTKTAKPAGYPADATTDPNNPNDYVAKVNGSGNKIGPSILLKVMAGDKLNIAVNSWYKKNGASPDNPTNLLTSLVAALAGGVSNAAPTHGTAAQLTSSGALDPAAIDFLNSRSAVTSGKPKAALNWVFLDEQLKFNSANGAYGTNEVGDDNQTNVKQHAQDDIEIKKNGYFFVYVSNETPNIDVFFDNLKVLHKRGAVLEETHYYPFGLTMAGISSKALNGFAENKYKFNGGNELQNKEFGDGNGLELYDATFRMYDAQIGRFHQVDPLAILTESWNIYQYSINNPILFNDPLGLSPTESDRPNRLTDWVRDKVTGKVYFDPAVKGPGDVKPNQTYIGREVFITDEAGNRIGFGNDQGGISFNVTLPEVTITLRKCPTCLDYSTIKNNLGGLTYPGGNNPRSFNKKYNYSYVPSNLAEYPAVGHDRRYDNLKVEGLKGLLTDTRAIGADWVFVMEQLSIASTPGLPDNHRIAALLLGGFLGAAATPKTALKLSTPTGVMDIQLWYQISNVGVTNAPSNQ